MPHIHTVGYVRGISLTKKGRVFLIEDIKKEMTLLLHTRGFNDEDELDDDLLDDEEEMGEAEGLDDEDDDTLSEDDM